MFASRTDWHLTPNRLSLALAERRARNLPILDLTESNPTRCGFDYDAEEILGALSDPQALTYEPDPRGLMKARLAVAEYYAERGVKLDPAQIYLTTSTSEAYSYVFRLLANPSDEILAPTPSYPLFDYLSRLNDLELVPYPLVYDDGWQIDLHALESRLRTRTRAILVVHPNNPTGSFVRQEELDFLVRCANQQPLAIIADEVFADYVLSPDESSRELPVAGAQARAPAAGEWVRSHAGTSEALTFTLSGLSKISGLPQMKLAWIVVNGPGDLLVRAQERLELIADTYLSVAAPLAHALPRMLEMRRALQPQILKRLHENLAGLDQQLLRDGLIRRLKVAGGWYVTLRLPSIRTDDEWTLNLLQEGGVLAHPGHFFDFHIDHHLVVSLLTRVESFQEGIERVVARVAKGG
ncbi:MAG: pyridoxal phosphate-dependent aminotransferase [Terriglobia bacterium]